MAGSKSTQTRVVGIKTDKIHPSYNLFSSNRVSMKNICRDASCLLLSLPLLFVYFLILSSANYSSNFLAAF